MTMVDPTPTPSPTPTPDPAPNGGGNPWHHGMDPDFVGQLTNRGLATKTPQEAALAFHQAHREAEKFIGAPADQLVRLPKDIADGEGWKTVYGKLGVPSEAKDYDLSALKDAAGNAPDQAFLDWVKQQAFELKLPKDRAADFANRLLQRDASAQTNATAIKQAALLEEKKALDTNWGTNKEANMIVARQAAKNLGLDPTVVNALEGAVGYAKVMEMFRELGARMGEDKFINGGQATGGGVMSRDQATAQKRSLMQDQAWVTRYLAGGTIERTQMQSLEVIIAGV